MNKKIEKIESYFDSFIVIKRKDNNLLTVNTLSNSGIKENDNINFKNKTYNLQKLNIKPYFQMINYLSFCHNLKKIMRICN